jgi:hypothetical protein
MNDTTEQRDIRRPIFILAILAFTGLTSILVYDRIFKDTLSFGVCHAGESPPCIYHLDEKITVPPMEIRGGVLRQNIECLTGDFATGGGYFLNTSTLTDDNLNVEVFSNHPITDFNKEGTGWDIGIRNKTPIQRTGFAHVACFRKK